LGLTDWAIHICTDRLNGSQAKLYTDMEGCSGTAFLNSVREVADDSPEELGQHEAFHLLIASLTHMAHHRNTSSRELENENERIVNRLQAAVPF